MDGTIQAYVLDMAADTKKEPLRVKQYDTNSRQARITLKMGGEPWTIPFGCQIHINVRKTDGTLADATCTRIDEHTVLTPITEQMTAVMGTQLGELYFLGSDGDIKSQSFPVVVYEAVMDQARMESSDDFQSLQDALRDVKTSTASADRATQYATEQGDQARDAAQRAEDAAASIQVAVDAAANAKACESNAKNSELAAAQTQQEVTDYVEAQKAAFAGYSQRESDSKYANALTETATGEGGVTVEDAWTAPVLGLDVAGRSEQVVTTGAQLLDWEKFSNFGAIDDTGYAVTAHTRLWSEKIAVEPGDIYTLMISAKSANNEAITLNRIVFYNGDTFLNRFTPTTQNPTVITIPAGVTDIVWDLRTANLKTKLTKDILDGTIMLNAGDTALPYEPYTGGAPSPSPDYPQDIISTGTVSTGAQLFYKSLVTLQGTGAEADITDKRAIKITYTRANGGKYAGFIVDDKSNIVGKTLTISYGSIIPSKSGLTPGIRLYWIDNNGSVLSYVVYANTSPTTITIEDPQNDAATKLGLLLYADVGDTAVVNDYVIYKDIMINAGDTALPWEPYTGGKPSPSVEYPQELEVVVTGAQMFDASTIRAITKNGVTFTNNGDGSIAVKGTTTDLAMTSPVNVNLQPGTYFVSGTSGDIHVIARVDSGNTFRFYDTKSFTINEGTTAVILYVQVEAGKTVSGTVRPMLNAGDQPLPWEPYKGHQTATITLTEPLRGIGEYRDRIMCRDGVWGIERWITKLTLAGNEDWVIYDNSSYISFYTRNPCLPVSMNKREGLCEQLRVMTIGGKNLNTIWLGANNKVVYAIDNQFYNDTLEDKGLANWKAHLAESPLEIITYLDAPAWEPLPDATQQALNELTTYAGTTHLTITAGGPAPTVTLDYVQDTHKAFEQCQEAAKEYTDNQIAAIVAALPTATQAAIVDNQTSALLAESEV